MKLTTILSTLTLSTALLISASSCTSSATAGNSNTATTFNKTTGNIYTTVDRSLDDSFDAVKAAMTDMGYTTESSNKDVMKGVVKAREADNSLITSTLERQSDKVTQIEINVGVLGNEAKARLIMDKVLHRLGR